MILLLVLSAPTLLAGGVVAVGYVLRKVTGAPREL